MADNSNINQRTTVQTEFEIMSLLNSTDQTQPVTSSIWTTVNTSTTPNVERFEIRKSEDYDRVVKKHHNHLWDKKS